MKKDDIREWAETLANAFGVDFHDCSDEDGIWAFWIRMETVDDDHPEIEDALWPGVLPAGKGVNSLHLFSESKKGESLDALLNWVAREASDQKKRVASAVEQITIFDEKCAAEEYTDTGMAWDVMRGVVATLSGAP